MSGDVIMVTGGAGFVGSHLVESLLEEGHQVHVLDVADLDNCNNLREVKGHKNLVYTQGDLRDKAAIADWYQKDAEHLYHLASVVGVRHYMTDPFFLIDVVVGGTRTLLDHARKHDTRVLYTSTSEVYGKNPAVPWSEDGDRVLGPPSIDRWSYSSSKAVCEHMLFGLHRSEGLRFTTVRYFNVYGPRQNPIYVVSQSVYRAMRGEQPDLYDGGEQTRCFTYVDDAIKGTLLASRADNTIGEIINIGNDVEKSMKTVVDHVITSTGDKVAYKAFDTQKEYGKVYEDIPRRVPKNAKAFELFGWKPEVQVEEGIDKIVEWTKKNDWYLADMKS